MLKKCLDLKERCSKSDLRVSGAKLRGRAFYMQLMLPRYRHVTRTHLPAAPDPDLLLLLLLRFS